MATKKVIRHTKKFSFFGVLNPYPLKLLLSYLTTVQELRTLHTLDYSH